jgi:acetylornithine deacetylase/succinyl-diaminopimelate desuccinylase-like protein
MKRLTSFLLFLAPVLTAAQGPYPTKFSKELAEKPTVQEALRYVDEHFEDQVEEWIRITEIPALSRHEAERAVHVRKQLEDLGLDVKTDSIGNVVAFVPGTGGGPTVVFAAHMDTVHPMDTDVTVKRRDGELHAPGVYDNSASVSNMIAAARAIRSSGLRTKGDVYFIGTVQEELGLNGMEHWLEEHTGVTDMLVGLDGGLGSVSYGALGIYWSEMRFHGEGAHTLASRGRPHPARAAARCILDIYTIPLPPPGPASAVYNVGKIHGGDVVNAIAQDVYFTVDLRTVDPELLPKLDAQILAKCEDAAKAEGVDFERHFITRNEAGGTPDQLAERRAHPIVQTGIDVLEYLGVELPENRKASASGSTDANAGVLRGIPSIAVGRGRGGKQHTLAEWANIDSARTATKQIVLLVASLAELDEAPSSRP